MVLSEGGGGDLEGRGDGALLSPGLGPARPVGVRDPLCLSPLPPSFRLPAGTRHCTARPWRTADPSQRRTIMTRPPSPARSWHCSGGGRNPPSITNTHPPGMREAPAPRLCSWLARKRAVGKLSAAAVLKRRASPPGRGTVLGGRGAEPEPNEERSPPGGRCPPVRC